MVKAPNIAQRRADAAKIGRALSDPTRLRVLALLRNEGPLCLVDIMAALNIKQPIASHHTSVLMGLGMLDRYREGRYMMYRIGVRSVEQCAAAIVASVGAR